MNINKLSQYYTVKMLTESDVDEMYELAMDNKLYYSKMNEKPTKESLKEDLTNVPKNVGLDNKYMVGFYKNDTLIAILDLIIHYPNDDTAFIGWFILSVKEQGKGVGSKLYSEIENYIKSLHYKNIELGFVLGNKQSENFWKKCGFLYNGEIKKLERYSIVKMKKVLV